MVAKGQDKEAVRLAKKRYTASLNRSRLYPDIHSIVPPPSNPSHTCFGRAIHWIVPWPQDGYPGIERAVKGLLGGRATYHAYIQWRAGRAPAPDWFAQILAGLIRSRIEAGQSILAELEAYRRPVHPPRGAMKVDPVTGTDRRGSRIGRRQKEPGEQNNP